MSQTLDLVHQSGVPSWQHIHIVIHKIHVVCDNFCTHHIHRQTDANILWRIGIVKSLFLYPFQRTIRAIVDMYDDLVLKA